MRKKKKASFRPQFRRKGNANAGHPTYLFAKMGDEYKFIGITHAEITDGTRNIPLVKNPNPCDSRNAYIRPFAEKDKVDNFGMRAKDWSFSSSDMGKVKSVIKKDKKKK